ncbi:MAG: sulfatase-like hydrolase/transferase, partial [Alphaproteobacteria bacterium]|nr:sulfatase-like hydrolase/transferase [Alphaproteobacteria bacterium]
MLHKLLCFGAIFVASMALLMLPEVIVHQVMGLNGVIFSPRYWVLLTLIVVVVLFDRHLRWTRVILGIIAVIFVMQFAHIAFFGRAFDPFSFDLLTQESPEVLEVLIGALPKLWWVVPLGLLPPIAVYSLLKRFRPFRGIPSLGVLPILIFAFGVYRPVNFENVTRAFPNAYQPVIENFLTAFGGYVFLLALAKRPDLPDFAPYQIAKTPQQPAEDTTVVLVYGESLGVRNFSALGYERETTPKLEALLQQPGSALRVGIASGISTRISTPLFMNLVRDPRDRENSLGGYTNIFKLAKQQGFETYYFSAQLANLLAAVDTGYIDHMITKDTRPELFATRWDEGLIDLVEQEIDLTTPKKRLIILHTRSAHAPYSKNTQFRPELAIYPDDLSLSYADLTRNHYDNSVRYNDFVLEQLYRTVEGATSGPLYFWLTSDHGEMIDYNGQYGHTLLEVPSVEVPIGLLSRDADPTIFANFVATSHLTHWDLGR